MVHKAVYSRNSHDVIWKDLVPLAKGLVRSNEQAVPFITLGDQFKQNTGFGFVLLHITNII